MHLLKSETTIAEVLKENGYATAHFGKWHLGMPVNKRENPTPAEHGFDYWFGLVNGPGPSHKNPTQFLAMANAWDRSKATPAKSSSMKPSLGSMKSAMPRNPSFSISGSTNLTPRSRPDEIVSRYGGLNDQAAIYSGTIDNTDRAIGRLVARLEKLGELENTIIVYASDNGSYRPERNGEMPPERISIRRRAPRARHLLLEGRNPGRTC